MTSVFQNQKKKENENGHIFRNNGVRGPSDQPIDSKLNAVSKKGTPRREFFDL